MIKLSDIKASVRGILGRGTTLDSELDGFIRRAVQYIERRKSFNYMLHYNEFELDPEAQYPRTIEISEQDIKSFRMVRLVFLDGSVRDLTKKQIDEIIVGEDITQFAQVQSNLIILNALPEAGQKVELAWYEFSSFGTDDNFTHPLMRFFEDGLIARTIVFAALRVRDKNLVQEYNQIFEDAMTTALMSEEELDAGTSHYEMGGYYGE